MMNRSDDRWIFLGVPRVYWSFMVIGFLIVALLLWGWWRTAVPSGLTDMSRGI